MHSGKSPQRVTKMTIMPYYPSLFVFKTPLPSHRVSACHASWTVNGTQLWENGPFVCELSCGFNFYFLFFFRTSCRFRCSRLSRAAFQHTKVQWLSVYIFRFLCPSALTFCCLHIYDISKQLYTIQPKVHFEFFPSSTSWHTVQWWDVEVWLPLQKRSTLQIFVNS